VVFENGELKREPVEVTYRTVTYYYDDNVAKAVDAVKSTPVETKPVEVAVVTAPEVPEVVLREAEGTGILKIDYADIAPSTPEIRENPPPLVLKVAPPPTNSAMDLYETGRTRFESGDVKGAVDAYLQSIKLEPKSAEVYLNLGHAYLKLQKDADAAKAFKQSIKLNPDQPETQYGLGLAAFRIRRFDEAANAFKKATILSPGMAKAHYGLSLAYQELGNANGLLEEFRVLETLDKSLARKLAQTFPQYNLSCRGVLRGCP
jgi:tetratricopeptide (TPR) repeat protein